MSAVEETVQKHVRMLHRAIQLADEIRSETPNAVYVRLTLSLQVAECCILDADSRSVVGSGMGKDILEAVRAAYKNLLLKNLDMSGDWDFLERLTYDDAALFVEMLEERQSLYQTNRGPEHRDEAAASLKVKQINDLLARFKDRLLFQDKTTGGHELKVTLEGDLVAAE